MVTHTKFQDPNILIASVPNEGLPLLVKHSYNWQKFDKTFFASASRYSDNNEKEKKTRMEIARLFALHKNAITKFQKQLPGGVL